MKTNFWPVLAMVLYPLFLNAQDSPSTGDARELVVVETGPHERIWGTGDPQSHRRIAEVGTGMNYWDGQKWAPSDPTFDLTEDAFVADRLHYKVRLEANLNRIGSVTVITPDGINLLSSPVGIGLYDAATGVSVIVAAMTNTVGVLVGDNQVVYENAFSGVCADVVYTIDRGSFEQDVVITGRLDPADYGFPPNTTRIQIFTEFYDAPQPERILRPLYTEQDQGVRNRMASPDLVDEVLGFGEFVLWTGRAKTLANIESGNGGPSVAKQFTTIAGRTFLIESVEYRAIQGDLELLPDCGIRTASIRKIKATKDTYAAIPPRLPAASAKVAANRPVKRMAQASLGNRKGVIIDYIANIGGSIGTAKIFQGDTTYFLTNAVTCNGSATFEGGVVLKYPTNANVYLKLNGAVTFRTASYRPAIFTAADDDSVGDTLNTNIWSGYTGTIKPALYADPALWVANASTSTLSNVSVRYAKEAIRFEGAGSVGTLSHARLINCIRGIVLNAGGVGSGSVTVNNTLMSTVQKAFSINSSNSFANFYHSTVAGSSNLITSSVPAGTNGFYNSVFANVTNLTSGTASKTGSYNGFYNTPTFGTSQYSSTNSPFQTVGAGNYYLAASSPFRDVGVTNGIGSQMLAELSKGTTYPPIILTNTFTTATTLGPQAQRDTDTLDLGYHYEPIDWAVNTVTVTNTTLTLTNGVALATFGNSGIWLKDSSQLYSEGTPLNHNHLSRFFNVQEQPTNWGGGALASTITINPNNSGVSLPIAQLRFTDFDGVANSGYQIFTYDSTNWIFSSLLLRDCTFNSGMFYMDGPTNCNLTLNNNLFESVYIAAQGMPQIVAYNNLVRFGSVFAVNYGTNNWVFKDNAFDSSSIGDFGNPLTSANNAFINMTNRFSMTNATDKVLTSFTYATGTLGNYYQTSTNLYDQGSRTNAGLAGLYHYTVKTSQVKETNSVVDIGFHYVALSGGLPVDTDSDGTPDYLEDRDGDGTVDTGETDWQDSGDLGLKVWITEPKSNSNIP
jgi:hypothetical protein